MTPTVAVIGPSACGKSSLVRGLHRRGVVRVHPTWTTRPRRADERAGTLEHRFVTDEVFGRLCDRQFFLSTATPFGLRWRYGLPHVVPSFDGRIDLVMLRAPVVAEVRDRLPLSLVIQIDDDPERIARRLAMRGSRPHEICARLADNADEVALGRRLADVTLVNDGTIDDLTVRAAIVIIARVHPGVVAASGGAY